MTERDYNFFFFFTAAPAAYETSWVRGQIGATATMDL